MSPLIYVFCGGVSEEREVSLRTGDAIANSLAKSVPVEKIELTEEKLPEGLDYERAIVFPGLHGRFGEDGALQSLLSDRSIEFVGCGSDASEKCFNKSLTKDSLTGIPLIPGTSFSNDEIPSVDELTKGFGDDLVLKPACQGSSVGLHLIDESSQLESVLSNLAAGKWVCEKRIRGRELTVGLLNGKAMGIVEVFPEGGVYDFQRKYQPGETRYEFPATLEIKVANKIKAFAEDAFSQLGCRDFARIDFMLEGDSPYLMEVNTLPGMTETSLMPKSASCLGMDFDKLVQGMVEPAIRRFKEKGNRI